MERYNVIGIMSGTSLDGLDLCYATFTHSDRWEYTVHKTLTLPYPSGMKGRLKQTMTCSGLELSLIDNELGNFIGNAVRHFLKEKRIPARQIDFVASHGHTVFHQPEKQLTLQIGNGANIAAITKLSVVCDFRSVDLVLHGNGAPLVPIGDRLLFGEYDSCVNLGGIANISFEKNKKRMAFDICPVNLVFNHLANRMGLELDKGGEIARSGKLDKPLLAKLNKLSYYQQLPPKSLGYEWVAARVFPKLEGNTADLLHTFTEHAAQQIAHHLKGKALFTGGGTYNTYFMERIAHYADQEPFIPAPSLIEFKEALIFGFLGVLRWKHEKNVLKSVTGSSADHAGGCIYQPFGN
ncbi:MAG: anhydro-N-acetylmuramic acid kinase [Flavobacteriales bacterium]|nr:anhydro-N-acetylmuramic acid kinase [Flavobacteriales bacterium]